MYVSYIKMLMDFNDTTLYDPVSGGFFQSVNSGDNTSIGISDTGYHMRQDQYLVGRNIDVDIDPSGFSISFWLYSVNPGQVQNPSTDLLETLRMPVVIFSDTVGDFDQVVMSVYENTNVDGTNKVEIIISSYDEYGSVDEKYVVYSDSYEVMMSHHFFINICVEKQEIQITIDGVDSSLNDISGTLPTSFDHSSFDVGINKIAEDEYAYNLANNFGIIDDIGFFNLQFDVPSVLPKLINEGLEEFADLNLRNNEKYFQPYLFDDPTTLKVNAMIDDMSYVYLARNDGKILFGSPLLWESRRVFSDDKENGVLEDFIITETDPTPAIVVNGFLQIKDSIIRL